MRSYFEIQEQLIDLGLYEDKVIYCINTDIIESDCEGLLTYDSKNDIWACNICCSIFKTSEIVNWIAEQEIELCL